MKLTQPERQRDSTFSSRFDHVRKIMDRKQRTDIGKYSFVIRTINKWKQLPAEALGTSIVNLFFISNGLFESHLASPVCPSDN